MASSFPICIVFVLLSYLIALAQTSGLCWIAVVRMGVLVWPWILVEILNLFLIHYGTCYRFFIYFFGCVGECCFYKKFAYRFHYEKMLHFIKCFLYVYWNNRIVFILQLVKMIYHIYLHMSDHPCISGTNPTWSMWSIFLTYCWVQSVLCWGYLHLCSLGMLVYCYLSWLCSLLVWGLRQRLLLFPFIYFEYFEKNWN